MRRGKVHIHDMNEQLPSVAMILGTNGYIWIHSPGALGASVDLRERMSLLRNAIVCLEKAQIPIYKDTIVKVLDSATSKGVKPREMLAQCNKLTKEARLLIEKEVNLHRPQMNMLSFGGLPGQNDFTIITSAQQQQSQQ